MCVFLFARASMFERSRPCVEGYGEEEGRERGTDRQGRQADRHRNSTTQTDTGTGTERRNQLTSDVIPPLLFCLLQSAVDGGDSYLVPVVRQTLDDAQVRVGLLDKEGAHRRTVVGVDRVCGHTSTSESHSYDDSISV